MILLRFRSDWPGTNHKTATLFVRAISKNTLPIFLFHVIILESFERGLLGFKLSFTTLNPTIEIPLLAALTFFITLRFGYINAKSANPQKTDRVKQATMKFEVIAS